MWAWICSSRPAVNYGFIPDIGKYVLVFINASRPFGNLYFILVFIRITERIKPSPYIQTFIFTSTRDRIVRTSSIRHIMHYIIGEGAFNAKSIQPKPSVLMPPSVASQLPQLLSFKPEIVQLKLQSPQSLGSSVEYGNQLIVLPTAARGMGIPSCPYRIFETG